MSDSGYSSRTPNDLPKLIGGRYRITGQLGEGGMGVVYRAVDEQLHRPAAVKFIPAAALSDPDRVARFKNEARALAALNHPHIITIYEVGEADGEPFLATELVDGQTLRDRLRAGPLALREALEITLQAARALAAAHQKRIVHRDVKPENVMIRADGYVKVLDFGLAGLRAPIASDRSVVASAAFETVAAAVAGTPAYMSPEQIDGAPADARSDVFSLGVLLCEAVTGRNPFARSSVLETISAIGQTPAPASGATATLPPTVRSIVLKALQKDPAQRYQSANDFVDALHRAVAALDGPSPSSRRGSKSWIVAIIVVALAAIGAAALAYRNVERRQWVREVAIPEITRLASDGRAAAAFPTLVTAERYLANDPELARAAAAATRIASIHSSPAGADVEVTDYVSPGEGWLRIGVTPLENVRIPAGYLRWRVKTGAAEVIAAPPPRKTYAFDMAAAVRAPEGMVPVPAGGWANYLAFLGWLGPYDLPAFFIDRYEVTNREYQAFVDKGGYSTRGYWKQPFVRNGREIAWDEAMALFRDPTGRPGPSTWEGGHYPEGKADYPVTGISWYEAAAYAEFAGKSLPVIAQVGVTAPYDLDQYITRFGNLSEQPAPVSTSAALGPFGTFDLVGNVREWNWNATPEGDRFLLGRQPGSYGPETLPPFDRSPLNGFRCVRNTAPLPPATLTALARLWRDFSKATPASDDVFRAYRAMYAYDRAPVHASVETVRDGSSDWTKQKIVLDAAYGNERLTAYLFLPRGARPPYQAVAFFPSARVNGLDDSTDLGDVNFFDYVVKSGRAVIYPVYQYLYERQKGRPPNPGPTLARDTVVDWSKDLGRSLDYLATRSDIDMTRVGYLGVSQGAASGVILAAIEDRLKAVVFLDGGMFQTPHPLAGLDQVDFAPRLTKPVLMVNGRYDATFPLTTAQEPLFRLLGTPAADKKHVVFETPHDVRLRRDDLVREVLAWYDRYLGRVK